MKLTLFLKLMKAVKEAKKFDGIMVVHHHLLGYTKEEKMFFLLDVRTGEIRTDTKRSRIVAVAVRILTEGD